MDELILSLLKNHSECIGDGIDENIIIKVEEKLDIKIPNEYRLFLLNIGYAEIYGDVIYYVDEEEGIVELIDYQNQNNQYLEQGFLEFFSNDIDGWFYINIDNGKVYLREIDNLFANSFNDFIVKMLSS